MVSYVFGDFGSAEILSLTPEGGLTDWSIDLGTCGAATPTIHAFDLTGFGTDAAGEVYAMDWNLDGPAGQVWKIAPDCVGESFCDTPGVDAGLNSTGETARTCATGSLAVDENALWLYVDRLPEHQIGYFLASRTPGNVPGAGGSQGVLCLGGAIGRFNSAIFHTGNDGHGLLAVDLGALPSPTGPVAVQPGETWRFQAWFRDAVGGAATSNFTDAAAVRFL